MRLLFCLPILFTFAAAEASDSAIEPGSRGVSNFIATMEKERKAHVAFLGGSITENKTGHSKMVADWLVETWSDVNFTFTNAGLASTCSVSGAGRIGRDVLAKGDVDLLIVEFAVNDDQDAAHDRTTAIRGLEGIIRQYFAANPKGDIISVQYVNPSILQKAKNGEEAVSVAAHKSVARHYDVPIVDVGLALAREIEKGTMTWEEDYKGTHPNQAGYRFASDLIISVIEETISGETPQNVSIPEPIDPHSYSGVTMIDPQKFHWLGGWNFAPVSKDLFPEGGIRENYLQYKALRSDSAGDYLYYTFSGKMLGAFVLAGPDSGSLEVSVDNGEWKSVELYHRFSKGLNYPRTVILADNLTNGYHQIALRTAKSSNPASKGSTASILWFIANQ